MSDQEVTIVVCVNERFGDKPSCAASGSKEIANAIEEHISSNQLNFKVKRIQCFGRCFNAPVVRIAGGEFFEKFSTDNMHELITKAREFSINKEKKSSQNEK